MVHTHTIQMLVSIHQTKSVINKNMLAYIFLVEKDSKIALKVVRLLRCTDSSSSYKMSNLGAFFS